MYVWRWIVTVNINVIFFGFILDLNLILVDKKKSVGTNNVPFS